MPWDEYLQWQNQLEAEDPCVEPDNSMCETDKASQEQTPPDAEGNGTSMADIPTPPPPPPSMRPSNVFVTLGKNA